MQQLTIDDVKKAICDVYVIKDEGIIDLLAGFVISNRASKKDPAIWLLILGGSSSGKCLGKGTPILMYDGTTKKVEDVVVGDKLMGDDSKPRNVLSLARGKEEMFKIKQLKGDDYIVNKSHILSLVYSSNEKKYKGIERNDIIDISVNEYINKNKTWKNKFKGYKVPIEFKKQTIKIDPYFLGIWLGDGSYKNTSIYKPDIEIKKFVQQYAKKLNMSYSSPYQGEKICEKHTISNGKSNNNPLKEWLKEYNLLNNKEKFIPMEYKINSREVRLQVLAGLLDTDGYYDKEKHHFDFVNKSKKLCDDIVFIARSLGFHASINKCKKGIKKIGFMGTYYRVYINGDLSLIPTKIKRKQAKYYFKNKNHLYTGIKVKSIGVGNYYGFEIDGNHRFLLGDFTVTHNTIMLQLISKCGSWIVPVDTLTVNTFASAFNSDAETSLLKQANFGILVFKDFTTITSMNEEGLREIMGQMRAIYDGEFVKRVGNNKPVNWTGKIGIIAAGTIDVQRKMRKYSKNGERFLNYIPEVASAKEIGERSLKNQSNIKEKEAELANLFAEFIKQRLSDPFVLSDDFSVTFNEKMVAISDFATLARSPVEMNFKNPCVVDFVGDREMPGRMVMMLKSVAIGVMRARQETTLTDHVASILYKIALDSIPVERKITLKLLAEYRCATTKNIAIRLHYTTDTVRAWLNQLNALKMVDRLGGGAKNSDTWMLKDEYKHLLQEYLDIKPIDTELDVSDEEAKNAYIEGMPVIQAPELSVPDVTDDDRTPAEKALDDF